ncbi:MAG TPA: hypothetical protein VLV15_06385 [Dongiaceae bacterium]|nr:hypothetical protein [Dongiaceae bacterium]
MTLSSSRRFAANVSTAADPVQTLLRARGCPDRIVEGGLNRLAEQWENVVASVTAGYALGLDDYLHDMDVRQILEDALAVAGPSARRLAARVAAVDEKLRKLLAPAGRCLWGDALARRNRWTVEKNWWYFTRPREAAPALLEDIGV